ncbi:MAG: efflux RND transporter permease subunit [Candidatus Obscuribacterales bacterium]
MALGLTILLIFFGLVAWKLLQSKRIRHLANPQVRVITLLPGKGAEEVERLITVPLEKEMNGIPNQTALRSLSLYGLSVIISTFSDGTSTNVARQQVLERVHERYPQEAQPHLEPDVGSLREIYRYSLHSTHYSPMGLRAIEQWELRKTIQTGTSVIGVVSEGGPTQKHFR